MAKYVWFLLVKSSNDLKKIPSPMGGCSDISQRSWMRCQGLAHLGLSYARWRICWGVPKVKTTFKNKNKKLLHLSFLHRETGWNWMKLDETEWNWLFVYMCHFYSGKLMVLGILNVEIHTHVGVRTGWRQLLAVDQLMIHEAPVFVPKWNQTSSFISKPSKRLIHADFPLPLDN